MCFLCTSPLNSLVSASYPGKRLVLKQNTQSKIQKIYVTIYEGQYESNAYFFIRSYNYNDSYNEIYVCHGYTLYKAKIIFSTSPFINTFSTFACDIT